MFLIAACFAIIFLLPTVLTFTNSFMSQTELSANYGQVFGSLKDSTKYVAEQVNLKFIPDKVTFKQYFTVLLASPDYLLKFWNSVILVIPIVLGQVGIAALASYSLMRYTGKIRKVIFFVYVILMLMPYQVMLVPNYIGGRLARHFEYTLGGAVSGLFCTFFCVFVDKIYEAYPRFVNRGCFH